MRYESESGDIVLALTGESAVNRALAVFKEERFLKMVEMIRNADASFTNSEGVFQTYEDAAMSYGGSDSRGTHLAMPPWIIKELRWLGIKMVSTANNHAFDFGEAGLLTNLRYLEEEGMPYAGTGRNLAEARAPVYLDTNRGRVALIAAADWGPRNQGLPIYHYPMGILASEQSPYLRGRPGVNLLRHRAVFTVDRTTFDALRRANRELGLGGEDPYGRSEDGVSWGILKIPAPTETSITFMDVEFILGESFSMHTVADQRDMDGILKWVSDARRMADWVLVSFHDHGASRSLEQPSDHAIILARECIDRGADVFIGHGPHCDRGIEIYKGKLILYSLSWFIRQNRTAQRPPYEAMARYGLGIESTPADFNDARTTTGVLSMGREDTESALVMVSFRQKQLKEVRLYPVDLCCDLPRSQSGRPVLAEPGSEVFNRVLERFQRCSEPFGTKIQIEKEAGVIRVD